jgi:hypothetical protein
MSIFARWKLSTGHLHIIELHLCFECLQAFATPREILLNKVPFPLPNPKMFNLDEINSLTMDTVVSENGEFSKLMFSFFAVLFQYFLTLLVVAFGGLACSFNIQ